jgi:hypothetical protein
MCKKLFDFLKRQNFDLQNSRNRKKEKNIKGRKAKQSKGTDTLMRLQGYNLDLLFACCFCWRDIDPSAGDFTHLAQLKPLLCQYWMMMDNYTHTQTHTHTQTSLTLWGRNFGLDSMGSWNFILVLFHPPRPQSMKGDGYTHTYMHTELLTDTWRCKEEISGRWWWWWWEEKPTFVTLLDKSNFAKKRNWEIENEVLLGGF